MSIQTSESGLSRRSILKRGGVLAGAAALLGASQAFDGIVRTAAAAETTLSLDVACDGATFTINRTAGAAPNAPAQRGDTFIVQGRIFAAGTIEQGLSGPRQPGSIGTWMCRGVFQYGALEIMNGAVPHVVSTQFFLLDNGDGLVSDGLEGGIYTLRTVVGGYNRFSGARGQQHEREIGGNETFIDLGTLLAADDAEPQQLLAPAPNISFDFELAP